MAYAWDTTATTPQGFDRDPWSWWVALRPGANPSFRACVPGDASMKPSVLEATGWTVPPIYAEDAPCFTAVQPIAEFLAPRASAALPPNFKGIGSNPGLFRTIPAELPSMLSERLSANTLQQLTLHAPAIAGSSWPAGWHRPGFGIDRALLAPLAEVALQRPDLTTPPLAALALAGARPAAAPPVVVPATRSSAAPIFGIIDTAIGFLHPSFRDASGQSTRIVALWCQESPLPVDPVEPPWTRPASFGYGQEIDRAAIDVLIDELATRPGASEDSIYGRIGHPAPRWSHGAHVLSLLAGRPEPVALRHRGQTVFDAAADADIVAVQLPAASVEATHGNWLSAAVLDALHYILDKADPAAPVVVNISLGSHSGPHDGSSLLEHALDALIDAQQGRLTVVVAAGNARVSGLHVRRLVAAGASTSFELTNTSSDPTPNFIECWCRPAVAGVTDSAIDLRATLAVHRSPTVSLASLSLQSQATGGQQVALRLSGAPAGSPSGAVAALAVSPPGDSPNGEHGVQILACIGPSVSGSQPPLAVAPSGRWVLTVTNGSGGVELLVNARPARDDTVYGASGPARSDLVFDTSTTADGDEPRGTMSNLASASRVVAVGGYDITQGLLPDAMYERSGCGMPAGEPDAAAGRVGPDVCGPARIAGGGITDFAYHGNAIAPTGIGVGTSMAAPVVARQLLNILAAERSFMTRELLLEKLKAERPGLPLPSGLDPAWTSSYWMPLT